MVPYPPRSQYLTYRWYIERMAAFLFTMVCRGGHYKIHPRLLPKTRQSPLFHQSETR